MNISDELRAAEEDFETAYLSYETAYTEYLANKTPETEESKRLAAGEKERAFERMKNRRAMLRDQTEDKAITAAREQAKLPLYLRPGGLAPARVVDDDGTILPF